ncbi:hypothetical protein KKI24_06295 [bacterium]|nr:hypothetical protein [bacterium]
MVNKSTDRDRDPEKKQQPSWLDYIRKTDAELLKLCRVDTFRGSGKGGQKRNKTSNAVRLTLFDIAVTESAARSRALNINHALRKLRVSIALNSSRLFDRSAAHGSFPEEIQPYLFQGIIRIQPQNPVFPVYIGCLVDLFIQYKGSWSGISLRYGVSNSQLRRFVGKHPALSQTLERIRKEWVEDGFPCQAPVGEKPPLPARGDSEEDGSIS